MNQLKKDITELLTDPETIKTYFPDYDGEEYEGIVIKEAYEVLPEISYPLVTIQEIENKPNERYWDRTEFATELAYQFTINCEQTTNHTANQNVVIIEKIIDKFMQGERYNCFRRLSATSPIPTIDDPNIRTGFLRYDCNLVESQNTIYRRY